MATATWSRVNYADAASLVPSAQAASLPAANLRLKAVSDIWRLPDASGTLDIDFGAAVELGWLGFVQPNDGPLLAGDDVVRWQAGSSAGAADIWDSGALDAGVAALKGYHVHLPASPVTARHLRLSVSAAALSAIDIGRLWCGPRYTFERNISSPWTRRWVEGTTPKTTGETSLVQYARTGVFAREYTCTWPYATPADAEEIELAQRTLGTTGQLMFSPDPDAAAANAVLASFVEPQPISDDLAGLLNSFSCTLIEQR